MALIDGVSPGQYIFKWLDDELLPMLSNSVAGFMQIISPVMGAAVLLWFVIWAWRYIREEQPMTDLLLRFFILSSVAFFAFTAPYFVDTIIPMVNNIPFDLAKPFINGGSGAGSSGELVNAADQLAKDNLELIEDLWEDAELVSWGGIDLNNLRNLSFATLVIGLLGTAYAAIGLFFIVVAKLMVNVILAIGPMFIASAFFGATKNYFTLWVNQLVNYILLATLIAVVFSIQITLVQDLTSLDDGFFPMDRVAKLLVVYIIAIATLVSVPTLASSLSGGMGINGLVGNTAQTAMSGGRGMGQAGKALGGFGGRAMSGNSLGGTKRPG